MAVWLLLSRAEVGAARYTLIAWHALSHSPPPYRQVMPVTGLVALSSTRVGRLGCNWLAVLVQLVRSERTRSDKRAKGKSLTAKLMQNHKSTIVTHRGRPCTDISILAPFGSYA